MGVIWGEEKNCVIVIIFHIVYFLLWVWWFFSCFWEFPRKFLCCYYFSDFLHISPKSRSWGEFGRFKFLTSGIRATRFFLVGGALVW